MIAPAQVANLIGRVGSRTIFLRWTAGSEQDLEGYNLYRASGEDPLALIASNLAEARFMNEGLIDEVVYRYSVTAFDGSGNEGERSAEVLLTPSEGNAPSAPVFRTIRGDVLMPTFVVENASGAEGRDLSYTFHVSVREDFADVVAAAAGIMEGNESEEGGLTAWTIPRELTEGATYFLRVRANDGFDGPFMPVHRFLASDVALARELRPGDFDGSFKVDFEDFFLFAAAFGQSGTGENAVFDLSVDNKIDFEDFFVFASVFGKQYDPPGGATKLLAFVRPLDPTLRVRLTAVGNFPSIGEEFIASIALEGLPDLRGYGIRIEFDSEQLELLHVEQQENGLAKVLRTDINEAVILNYGAGLVSEAMESEGSEGEGSEGETNLADLRFRVKVSTLEPHAEVLEMVLLDSEGEMRIPGDLSSARLSLLPNQVLLKHNYPNPFNPITTIRYGIPDDARVSILVYNILGQQVAQLVNELQPTGFYTIAWDGRDTQGRTLASGVYIYRIQVGKIARVQKMMLLK